MGTDKLTAVKRQSRNERIRIALQTPPISSRDHSICRLALLSLQPECFVKIRGKQHYLWCAVDQDGEVIDVLLQARRDGKAAKRFFKRLLKVHGGEPRRMVTDKLRSYGVAHRELLLDSIHDTSQYGNNRAEVSHQPTRVRERGMRRFKSAHQAQRFLGVHAAVYNLFNLGRHLISARHYRLFRQSAFASWEYATGP